MSQYLDAVFNGPLDNRLCRQFNGKHEVTHLDGVAPEMKAKILDAYGVFFPKSVDRSNPVQMLAGAVGFSAKLGEDLPFLGHDNYTRYAAAGDLYNTDIHTRYLEMCLIPRNLSRATQGKSMDCVIHALAIAYVIGDDGWNLYHAYCDSDERKIPSRHLLLARPVGEAFVLLDPTRAASRKGSLQHYLLKTKAEFYDKFYEPAMQIPFKQAI